MPLYHFTDPRNLPSIKQFGLLSWKRVLLLDTDLWPNSSVQSRYYDLRMGLSDYVRLVRQPYHPMAYVARKEGRICNFVWLEISDDVLACHTTLFSNDNAVRRGVTINHLPETALASPSAQAEIMVKGHISPSAIKVLSMIQYSA